MSTVIYINYDKIKIVTRQGEDERCSTIPLKEGTVMHGDIVDSEEVVRQLQTMSPNIKKASLIVDSNNILVKRLDLPKIPKRKIQEILKREFDLWLPIGFYYGCSSIPRPGKEDLIVGFAIPVDFLRTYIEIFNKANIKLEKIDVATNCILKYVFSKRTLIDESFLLNVVTKDAAISILFENGEFKFANRADIYYKSEEDYISHFYNRLSTMLQFSKSNKTGEVLEYCYYLGLEDKYLDALKELTRDRGLDLEIEGRNDNMDYFYPTIGFIQNKKDTDILKATVKKKSKQECLTLLYQVLPIVILALLGIVYGCLFLKENTLQNQIDKTEIAIESYLTSKEMQGLEKLEADNDIVLKKINEYNQVITLVEQCQLLDATYLKLVYSDLTITSIDYKSENGIITIQGTSSSTKSISEYSKMLRDSKHTDKQYYNGYQLLTKQDGLYSFTIQAFWKNTESEDFSNDAIN